MRRPLGCHGDERGAALLIPTQGRMVAGEIPARESPCSLGNRAPVSYCEGATAAGEPELVPGSLPDAAVAPFCVSGEGWRTVRWLWTHKIVIGSAVLDLEALVLGLTGLPAFSAFYALAGVALGLVAWIFARPGRD